MSAQDQGPTAPATGQNQPASAPRRSSFLRDLRVVWSERGFRRLLATRLISQAGDGVFTAGLGTYVFFNAATFPSPAKGAAAFAVLYAPYSLIGPFAGVFIDRWSRRQILLYSALIRAVFVVGVAGLMASGNNGVPLYAAVLLFLGVNRFFLSSLSAALPHVVPEDKLVMANAVSPTAGGILAILGGVVGLGVNAATGDTEGGAAITLLVAAGAYVIASMVAATMSKGQLGPERHPGQARRGPLMAELRIVAAGLAAGARYIFRRRGPAAVLGATAGNRFFYGILFLMSILLYRNYFYHSSVTHAESHYTVLVTAVGIGYGCAAVVTPAVTRRMAKPAYIALMLAATAVVIGLLGESFSEVLYLIMGFVVGLSGQSVAICAVTILQEQLSDSFRGRAFAFYDMIFNLSFVGGALVSAQYMPATGKSHGLITLVAIGYAAAAAGYWLASRHTSDAGDPGGSIPADLAQRSSS